MLTKCWYKRLFSLIYELLLLRRLSCQWCCSRLRPVFAEKIFLRSLRSIVLKPYRIRWLNFASFVIIARVIHFLSIRIWLLNLSSLIFKITNLLSSRSRMDWLICLITRLIYCRVLCISK